MMSRFHHPRLQPIDITGPGHIVLYIVAAILGILLALVTA